jgi:hypothetical protein
VFDRLQRTDVLNADFDEAKELSRPSTMTVGTVAYATAVTASVVPARNPSASSVPVRVVKNSDARVPASAILDARRPDKAKYSLPSAASNADRRPAGSSGLMRTSRPPSP